ncbi:MAG: oligosaccharide flippase family protein [Rhodothermaceae bacterium]|nr:oligosaccharide flippase family protein [Rhodothermaceae bacterium]
MADKSFISKFLRGSAFTTLGTVVSIVFHFISIKVLAEYMPVEAFGVYSLVVIVSHGFQILGGLGLNLGLVRNLSGENEKEKKEVVSTVFIARFFQLVMLSVVVLATGHLFLPKLFDESITQYIHYVPIIFFLASFRELLFYLLQGVQLFNRYALINILSAGIRLGSIILFTVFSELTIEVMVFVEIITYGLSVIMLVIYSPFISFLTLNVSRITVKKLFSFCTPLYANDILTYIYNKVSVLLIASLLTPVSVAKYEMANKIPEGFGRLFSSLIAVYFPNISELLLAGKHEQASKFMNQGLIIASAGLALVTLVTFLFRNEIVLLVASEQYLDASLALALLTLNFSINAIARVMGYTVVAAGHSSVPVRINLIGSIVNIIGCSLLIPRFGFEGAIYSLVGMSTISQLLNFYYLKRASISPDLWGFSKSLILLVVVAVSYSLIGIDTVLFRGVCVIVLISLLWIAVPEVRKAVIFAVTVLKKRAWKPS